MSYHTSIHEAIHNAGRLVQENAEAIKLEGGARVLQQIRAIVKAQIPVMGHLGLTPRQLHFGGFKVQGKNQDAAQMLIDDAKRLEMQVLFYSFRMYPGCTCCKNYRGSFCSHNWHWGGRTL